MLDAQGVLNPGLMPQKLADLNLIAPARTEVDDVLVERWNRVSEVWRNEAEFRTAVLRYATKNAHRDPASTGLWPEVVYPLIERARWHRRIRPRTEAIWDYLCGRILHVPDAGIVLDRAIDRSSRAAGRGARRFAQSPGRGPEARRRGSRPVCRQPPTRPTD